MKNNESKEQSPILVFVNTSLSWGGLEMNTVRLAQWMQPYMDIKLWCQENSPIAKNAIALGLAVDYITKKSKYFPLNAARQLACKMRTIQSSHLFFCDNKDMSYCTWAKIFSPRLHLYYQQHMQIGINKKDLLHTIRYKCLSAWISPLESLAQEVKQKTRIDPSKVHCIPLGLDTHALLAQNLAKSEARTYWKLQNDLPLIGIMGRLDRLKNQHLLIRALKLLNEKKIFVNLLIVGEPTKEIAHQNYAEELKQMVVDAHLEDQVYFRPFTSQVATFYCALDIFVMATERETYGMVTLEAMLMGAPVLASDAGGSPEILQNGRYGTLFSPSDTQDLADKIASILVQSTEIAKKAEAAKQYVCQNFDYHDECLKIRDLVKHL